MLVLANDRATRVSGRAASEGGMWIRSDELLDATGFELKPEGACFGDLCFPLSPDERSRWIAEDGGSDWIDYSELAGKVGQQVVVDDEAVSLGCVPEARRSTLESGIAPDFEIEDRNGKTIRLSDFRGKKVLIVTWASW